ncbi:MAG TPA: hypothetical protein DGG94_07945 [Micromonosporaceae bacterium]|nr:hypothetical protein [Micromonosporaceae bacterium]HCU49717.1 hypothetical protein [Micromonosporaceae bacterium]
MAVREPEQWTEILAAHPNEVAGLARRLRKAALAALPDLTERFYPGWQGLGLKHPAAGLIATIFAREADVVVYLERGASLPDPDGLLEGAERLRKTRMMVFRPGGKVPTAKQFVAYLDLAIEYVGIE